MTSQVGVRFMEGYHVCWVLVRVFCIGDLGVSRSLG